MPPQDTAAGEKLTSIEPEVRDRAPVASVRACGAAAVEDADGAGERAPASVSAATAVDGAERTEAEAPPAEPNGTRPSVGTGSSAGAAVAVGVVASASAAGGTAEEPALPLVGRATSRPTATTTTAAADHASTLPDSRRRSTGIGKPSGSNGRARRVSSARSATASGPAAASSSVRSQSGGLCSGGTRRGSAAGANPSSAAISNRPSPRRPSSAASASAAAPAPRRRLSLRVSASSQASIRSGSVRSPTAPVATSSASSTAPAAWSGRSASGWPASRHSA